MALQIIICVEADKRSGTDNVYVGETLRRFYEIGNDFNINYVNMGGKSKYKATDVTRKIKQLTKEYKLGETVVVYCIDTDNYESNADHQKELNEIISYTKNNGYELVWFCHDVEEVFVGNSIHKDAKKTQALNFKKKGEIKQVNEKQLAVSKYRKCTSNILTVFDRYLKRRIKMP